MMPFFRIMIPVLNPPKVLVVCVIALLLPACNVSPYKVLGPEETGHGVRITPLSEQEFEILVSVSPETGFSLAQGYFLDAASEKCAIDKLRVFVDFEIRGYAAIKSVPFVETEESVIEVHGKVRCLSSKALTHVWIEPGSFVMGCSEFDDECRDDEKPLREAILSRGFWMSVTEVTVADFAQFVSESGYITEAEQAGSGGVLTKVRWENREGANWRSPGFEQTPAHPVVLVSQHDAKAFCAWAGGRLPGEAEWEYAARGGLSNIRYVWGNNPLPIINNRRHANVADQSAFDVSVPAFDLDYTDGYAHTSPAGHFEPNGFGLYDMAGNVLEWTADTDNGKAMARGGAWNNPPHLMRISRRSRFAPEAVLNILGFRCVRDIAPG